MKPLASQSSLPARAAKNGLGAPDPQQRQSKHSRSDSAIPECLPRSAEASAKPQEVRVPQTWSSRRGLATGRSKTSTSRHVAAVTYRGQLGQFRACPIWHRASSPARELVQTKRRSGTQLRFLTICILDHPKVSTYGCPPPPF